MKDYRDNMYLKDIASNDMEMTKDAIKNAKPYGFGSNRAKAIEFTRHCMNMTLKKLGIVDNRPAGGLGKEALVRFARRLDRKMHKKKIEIEQREKYSASDIWRNGIYIYQNGELVAFISNVLGMGGSEISHSQLRITRNVMELFVITNADLNTTQRIYTPKVIH